jgi:hypothetical protein
VRSAYFSHVCIVKIGVAQIKAERDVPRLEHVAKVAAASVNGIGFAEVDGTRAPEYD